MAETRSTCPYCGVGCGVIIQSDGAQITGVRGDPDHPANFGRLCTKGSTLHLTAAADVQRQTRLQTPLRRADRSQPLLRTSWEDALDAVAQGIAGVAERHGPDAVGLYLSGQLLTEDYYVFNKLGKGLLGTNNVDTNSRLCMSSAVAGYKASLGADSVPACYEDLYHAQTIFITGSNAAWAHPVLFRRLEEARAANPAMKLIVADPRRTETAQVADLHLPLLPGTDVALYHAMLHVMVWEGWIDDAYIGSATTGWQALRERVREYTPDHAARICGLPAADIVQAARWFANLDEAGQRRPTLSLYCQGLNQSSSGTDKNSSLINLHLATGQIGRAGAGPLSLTGQPNAMGGREVGGLANLLGAHRDLANPAHRAEVAAAWGVPEVPAAPGLTAVDMFEAAADGRVRVLWIASTNPAQSLPDQTLVRKALQRAELVIVQDAYAGVATLEFADIVLPAASWGEKQGTVTNSERRISRMRAAVPAYAESRADWDIAADVARRIEALRPPRRVAGAQGSMFDYPTAESVWNEHRESTRGRDLDITGLSYRMLEEAPRHWPWPEGAEAGRERLYADARFPTPDGKARFVAPAWRPVAEPRDARYPFSLTTGRLRDQWHTMSRTGTLGRLFTHAPEPSVDLHPQELERRGWKAGDLVEVRSRRGKLVLPVQPRDDVPPAQAFIAMHWGPEYLTGGVNVLTTGERCPQSRQPELKHAAVRIEAAALPWRVVAAVWLPSDQMLALRESVRAEFAAFEFASCVPFGREPEGPLGLLFRAAAPAPVDRAVLERLERLLMLDQRNVLHYDDRRAGQRRAVNLDAGALRGFLLAGETAAHAWMLPLLHEQRDVSDIGRQILAATPQPPRPMAAPVKQVCSCWNVSEQAIVETLGRCGGSEDDRLHSLQEQLRCGTQCGSCLPALRVLVRQTPVREDAPGAVA